MTIETDAQLRYLLRKARQLPMPHSHLLGSVSRRFATDAERMPSIQQQAALQKAMEEPKKKGKKDKQKK